MIRGYEQIKKYEKSSVNVGGLEISFQRTCRVPLVNIHDLPAGLGEFPIFSVNDFRLGAPSEWKDGAFFMPMYAQEAMWINFERYSQDRPRALIVAAGNINAISGKPFDQSLVDSKKEPGLDVKLESSENSQNYLVIPPQPWLDGWKAPDGKIYQFVAAELGSGQTVEGQITGKETVGGLQFVVYCLIKPMQKQQTPQEFITDGSWASPESYSLSVETLGTRCLGRSETSMGLGRGGEIKQKIYTDPYGAGQWKTEPSGVELVHIVSSEDFQQLTGHRAPTTPVTFEKYQQLGLPWFGLPDKHLKDSEGSKVFGKVKPVTDGKAPKKDPFDKFK